MTQRANGQPRVLSDEQRRTAEEIVSKYPHPRSAITALLYLVQSAQGYVTEEGMKEVGEIVGLTSAEVLAVASFYTMLKKHPQGQYLISVCRNVSCWHRGAREVIEALEERLGIEVGETTDDGKFSLETAECLATCDGAPSLQVNYEDFYAVSPQEAVGLVDRLERGEVVRSVRGQSVATTREISYQAAIAGLRVPGTAGDHEERPIGGEVPEPDKELGFRPKVEGDAGGQNQQPQHAEPPNGGEADEGERGSSGEPEGGKA